MALAAEENHPATLNAGNTGLAGNAIRIVGAISAIGLMLLAGDCFLKYLWWAANSSAWQGIPKYSRQWQAASTRTTVYGWSLLLLEIASVFVLFSLMRFRSIDSSKLRNALRFISSLIITVGGTAFLALLLSWIKQATP